MIADERMPDAEFEQGFRDVFSAANTLAARRVVREARRARQEEARLREGLKAVRALLERDDQQTAWSGRAITLCYHALEEHRPGLDSAIGTPREAPEEGYDNATG